MTASLVWSGNSSSCVAEKLSLRSVLERNTKRLKIGTGKNDRHHLRTVNLALRSRKDRSDLRRRRLCNRKLSFQFSAVKRLSPSQSDRQMFRSPNRRYILSRKLAMRPMLCHRIGTSAHHQSPQLRRKPNQHTVLCHPFMMERSPPMSMTAQWKLQSP